MIVFLESFFDERFVVHRLKATRFAAAVTALAMAGYLAYEFYVSGVLKLDILILMGVLAVAKIAAMTYYRVTGQTESKAGMLPAFLQMSHRPHPRGAHNRLQDWRQDFAQHSAAAYRLIKEANQTAPQEKLTVIVLGAWTKLPQPCSLNLRLLPG